MSDYLRKIEVRPHIKKWWPVMKMFQLIKIRVEQ